MTVTTSSAIVPGPYAIPAGRGRWRFTLHDRTFNPDGYGSVGVAWDDSIIAELPHARDRKVDKQWNKSTTATFTLDGRDPLAALVRELATDLYVWRFDDWTGRDVCIFHGVIDQAADDVTEDDHTVTFGAHDYLAMLERRRIYGKVPINFTGADQDTIAETLVASYGSNQVSATAVSMLPGSFLPLYMVRCDSAGSARPNSGQHRTISYQPTAQVSQLFDDLSKMDGGFDYDVLPGPEVPHGVGLSGPFYGPIPNHVDALRVFYSVQGVPRTDMMLVYGGNVSHLTRTLTSADYANRVIAVGNNATTDPAATKLVSDIWTAEARSNTVGLWMDMLNQSDVADQTHLDEQTRGQLAFQSTLIPTYTLGLRHGTYRYGFPNIGDIVPLVVDSGRLNVRDDQRVMGISWDISEDADEDVTITVGRPPATLGVIFNTTRRALDALNRR